MSVSFIDINVVRKKRYLIVLIELVAEAEEQQELDSLRIVENSLASVSREQKEVFMAVYQKFTQVLQELIKSNAQPESNWTYRWVFGWFREMLRVVIYRPIDLNTNISTKFFFF
jgi:nuclear cap-binding protein subunit 1